MSIRPLNISAGSEAELELISAAPPAKLREALNALRAAKTSIVSPVALRKIFSLTFNEGADSSSQRIIE